MGYDLKFDYSKELIYENFGMSRERADELIMIQAHVHINAKTMLHELEEIAKHCNSLEELVIAAMGVRQTWGR